jgi:parvulin-like peptidyl-prolyl isomerase
MTVVRQPLSYVPVLVGSLLVAALAASSGWAQDYWSGNSNGTSPMAPVTSGTSNGYSQTMVPRPPVEPGQAARPATWPGAAGASAWVPPEQRAATHVVPTDQLTPCTGIRIIGRVGSDAILESEVIGAVNETLDANKGRIPPGQVGAIREMLIKQRLKGLIENKLVFQDAKRTIPSEAWSNVEKQLTKAFEEGDSERPSELEKMMKKSGVNSRAEFDQRLRALGTSIEREKRAFIERTLAQEWIRQQIKKEEDPTYNQMVIYYRQHQDEFTTPARAQWEELMVRYASYPTRVAAFDAIARMGNQVLAGAPFLEVARRGSEGPDAAKGGQRDWTTKGALTCEELNAALFSLPVGQLSPIIAGPTGYHIIRVTRREDEKVKPFLDAQVDIKQQILQQRHQKQVRDYLAKLEARTPVWTIFDDQGGKPETANRPQRTPMR